MASVTGDTDPSTGIILEDRNKQVVQKLHDLKTRRADLEKDIQDTYAHKEALEEHIQVVRRRITQARETLESKRDLRAEYNQVILQIDQAYDCLVGESHKLLELLDVNTNRIEDEAYYVAKEQQQALATQAEEAALLMHTVKPSNTDNDIVPEHDQYTAPVAAPSKAATAAPATALANGDAKTELAAGVKEVPDAVLDADKQTVA